MKRLSSHRLPQVFISFILTLGLLPSFLGSQLIAVKAKKIHPVSQGMITDGVIVMRDGRIETLGTEPDVPWNAEIIDYSQKIIVPGLIEAHAARGYDLANETNPLTPFVTVLDSIDTSHDDFKTALRDGVTTLHILPGHDTIFGGKGSVVKPIGLVVEDMILVPDSAMKISVVGTKTQTRMGVMAQLRRYFTETEDYMARKKNETAQEKEKMVSTPNSSVIWNR